MAARIQRCGGEENWLFAQYGVVVPPPPVIPQQADDDSTQDKPSAMTVREDAVQAFVEKSDDVMRALTYELLRHKDYGGWTSEKARRVIARKR